MAAFNFPNSPSTNDTHSENNVTWKWDGTMWNRISDVGTTLTHLNVTGISTLGGNVQIGGVLTYEDVKNVDSVGIITARNNIHLEDYIYHKGDPDTYIGFSGSNTITAKTTGVERLLIDSTGILKLYGDNGNNSLIYGHRAGNLSYILGNQSGTNHFNIKTWQSSSDIIFSLSGNNEKVRITSAGKVGIGSAIPGRHFVVVDDTGGGIGVVGTNAGIYMGTHHTGSFQVNAAIARAAANNYHITNSVAGDLCIAAESTKNILFGTGSSAGSMNERFRIKANGSVYTVTQGAKFGISQDPELTTMGATSGTWQVPEVDGSTIGAEMRIGDHNTNSVALIRLASYGSGDDSGGGAIMFTNTRVGSALYHSDLAAIKGAREELGKGYLRFFTANRAANTEKMRITSAGKVGIGTNNPATILHLQSANPTIRLTDSNQAADNKNWNINGGQTQILRFQAIDDAGSGGGNLFDFYRVGNNIYEFRGVNSGNTWFTINNNTKKVGIGSDVPTGKLDIAPGGNSFIKFGQDSDNPKMEMFRSTGGSPSHYGAELQLLTGDFIFSNAPGANLGSHSYTERLRIPSTGGITVQQGNSNYPTTFIGGSTNGRNFVSVKAGNTTSGHNSGFKLYHSDGNGVVSMFINHNDDHGHIMNEHQGGDILFYTNQSGSALPKVRITSEGQVKLSGTNSGNHMSSFGTNVGGLTIDDVGNQHTALEVSHGSNKVFLVASSNNSVYMSSYGTGNFILEHTGGGGTRERLRIDSSGRTLIGHNANLSEGCLLQVARTNDNTVELFGYSANANGARVNFTKSRNGTIGTNTIVQNNDTIGELHFRAANGSGYYRVAEIAAEMDGTPSASSLPGRLIFATTASGATSQTERLRIGSDGISVFKGVPQIDNSANHNSSENTFGHMVQRNWRTTIQPGKFQLFADYKETEGNVALMIQVSSDTGGHSGTSTYYWQGGYLPSSGYGDSWHRLLPSYTGYGHGDSCDDGLTSNAWEVLIGGAGVTGDNYEVRVAVHLPTGRTAKSISITISEMRRGMTFTDLSSNSAGDWSTQTDSGTDAQNYVWSKSFITTNTPSDAGSNYNYRRNYLSGNQHLYWYNGNNQAYLHLNGTWTNASDIAYKKDVEEITYGIETVKQIKPRKYKHKGNDMNDVGFIAQELETVVPEVVSGDEGGKGISYGNLTAVLTKALQEAIVKIETLEAKVAALEGS